jgi:hypothetical protein
MLVQVERCWCGNFNYSFQLTFPGGKRESVKGEDWTRETASQALNIAEHLYGANRHSVRFQHH